MLRCKKRSQNSLDISKMNSSSMSNIMQTQTQTIEKQIDNYTRRLQQDKRRYFRAQENYSEIHKEFQTKNKQLEKLKSKKHKTQLITLKGKISTLQGNLDQIINSYNQALAKNNQLKFQIDELRKDKKAQSQKMKFLNQKLQLTAYQIQERKKLIQNKKANIGKMKEEIINYRQINFNESKNYQNEVNILKSSFISTGKENDRKNKDDKNLKTQNIDTQPIMKLRLRNIISQNKEKIKIIEQYRKNMHMIEESFEQIKQESGIQTLQQITKTFLKHEQQNGFIYQYISRLNQTIDQLKEGNQQMKKKIQQQQESNKQKRLLFSGTPEEQKRKNDLQCFKSSKQKKIVQMNNFLKQIKPKLMEVFKTYGKISENEDIELTPNNIQSYLADLQTILNQCAAQKQSSPLYKADLKQDATRYTKLPPSANSDDTIASKTQQKLLERQRLKDFANEFWQKKKMNRLVSSKGTQFKNQINDE